jgi:peptide deformylase|tara:strand:- start:72 stop:614 length:543 start_codon:yes stop_codon:yes gene_type:complete
MSVQTILKMGDPRLNRVANPVQTFNTPDLHQLIFDMRATVAHANGAGLAAPQIGVDLQVVIFGSGQVNTRYPLEEPIPETILINPVITPLGDDEQIGWEGCLSVPGLRGQVPRFKHIRYTGFDELGKPIDKTVSDFHARVVQHECDHLIGILYPAKIRDFSQFGYVETLFPELAALEGKT